MENLERIISDTSRGVCLFGTVPPRMSLSMKKVEEFADKFAAGIKDLDIDAIAVYDIQDEPGRCDNPRPFPFSPCHDSSMFADLLKRKTGIECIVYYALPYHSPEEYSLFLEKCKESNCKNLVLVGGPAEHGGLSVQQAAEIASDQHFLLGGITLPERHRDKGIEPEIILRKTKQGIKFFTSQVVYNADNAISFLKDYDALLKKNPDVEPARIIFTFAPFGREDTVTFMEWLGVELPIGTVRRVLSRGDPKECVEEAIDICRENLTRILDACIRYNIRIPLGFTTESVSKHREEIQGVSTLFTVLKNELDAYYAQDRQSPNHSPVTLHKQITANMG